MLALTYANGLVEISEHFEAEGIKIFNVTSKLHGMTHSLLLARHLHPYLTWCFKGEDMMQKSSRIFLSCVRGVKPEAAQVKSMNKLRCSMHFNWENAK